MSKVILEGCIEIPNDDLDAVSKELVNHINLTKKESGCITFRVEQDGSNKNRFNVYEEFTDEEAFKFHQARVKASRWGVITKRVKRHYRIKYL